MKYFIPLCLTAFIAGRCFGVTPDNSTSTNLLRAIKASPVPPAAWNGTVTMGLTATAGNVSSVLATGKIIAERKTKGNDLNLDADGVYGEVSSIESANSIHGSAQDNQTFIDDTWYGYGRGDVLHDAIANVDYRITSGAGVGYYFIKDKQTTLSAEAGPADEIEQLDDEYNNYPTARLAERYERKIDEHARIWENVEFLPPLTVPQAFLVTAEVGLETPLSHKLSLQTYLQDNFANVPAPGYKDNDLKLVSGLVLKF